MYYPKCSLVHLSSKDAARPSTSKVVVDVHRPDEVDEAEVDESESANEFGPVGAKMTMTKNKKKAVKQPVKPVKQKETVKPKRKTKYV